MFKICIVTVYNSINSGSFWQAYVLGKVLEQFNYQVEYLKRTGDSTSSNTIRALLKRVVRSTLHNGIHCGLNTIKQYVEFVKCWRLLSIHGNKNLSDIDYFILGSDTIWNFESNYFANNRKRYLGAEFQNHCVFSYAVSIANTTYEVMSKYLEIPEYLNKLRAISVRDCYSKKIISKITHKEVSVVCDPTLLWTVDNYFPLIGENPGYRYIFLYLFSKLTEEQNKKLEKFAHENHLLIVNGANNDINADLKIINSPFEFLRYLYFAEFVVTDTYHGVAFSTNFEKQFVVINREKNKVKDFMDFVHLSDRIIKNSNFSELFSIKIEFGEVEEILKKTREESLLYIKKVLKRNENECALQR